MHKVNLQFAVACILAASSFVYIAALFLGWGELSFKSGTSGFILPIAILILAGFFVGLAKVIRNRSKGEKAME
jgi:hypothetical protein